jgi:nucleoside-diphosphate-sugar epimerase
MMKILITGVHGFVGTNLVMALKAENEIYGLDIISPEKEGVEKTYSWEDMDNNAIPSVDAIIHLAGKAHDTKNQSKADVYFKVNTELTKKMYHYFLAHESIKKFIFFSSVKAATDRVEGEFVDENVEPKPVGPYGESKIKAEEYIMRFLDGARNDNASTGSATVGKQTYILRPCMIHGPGNKGNLNLLYGVVKKEIPWPLGAFENKRTFTSIDNLCYIINGLLTKDVESGIYNINDDEALSTNELVETICEAMGKKAHIWRIPRGLMEGVAKLGGLLHLPLNPERLQKLTENYVSSNAKIKRALGIEHLPVRAKDGLIKTIKSFVE